MVNRMKLDGKDDISKAILRVYNKLNSFLGIII